jgi:hypothetical protein
VVARAEDEVALGGAEVCGEEDAGANGGEEGVEVGGGGALCEGWDVAWIGGVLEL